MKKLLIGLLIIALAATFINDLGRWVTTSYHLDSNLREIADDAAAAARVSPTRGAPTASETARAYGIEVTAYEQKNNTVYVTARMPVTGTWLVGPVLAYLAKKPVATPYYVEAHTLSYYH